MLRIYSINGMFNGMCMRSLASKRLYIYIPIFDKNFK